jgi:hypothetical protein
VRQKLKFAGVPVYINGRNYFIPSLSLKQFEENQVILETGTEPLKEETNIAWMIRTRRVTIPVIGMALRRNYPEVTDENLLDWLDSDSHLKAWRATQGASGMEVVSEGEELLASE